MWSGIPARRFGEDRVLDADTTIKPLRGPGGSWARRQSERARPPEPRGPWAPVRPRYDLALRRPWAI